MLNRVFLLFFAFTIAPAHACWTERFDEAARALNPAWQARDFAEANIDGPIRLIGQYAGLDEFLKDIAYDDEDAHAANPGQASLAELVATITQHYKIETNTPIVIEPEERLVMCPCISLPRRIISMVQLVNRIETQFPDKSSPLVITDFCAGRLLPAYTLLCTLNDRGYQNLCINLIDIDLCRPTTAGVFKRFQNLLFSRRSVRLQYSSNDVYHYISEVEHLRLPKAHVLVMLDPGPINPHLANTLRPDNCNTISISSTPSDSMASSSSFFMPRRPDAPATLCIAPAHHDLDIATNVAHAVMYSARHGLCPAIGAALLEKQYPGLICKLNNNPFIAFNDLVHFTLADNGMAYTLFKLVYRSMLGQTRAHYAWFGKPAIVYNSVGHIFGEMMRQQGTLCYFLQLPLRPPVCVAPMPTHPVTPIVRPVPLRAIRGFTVKPDATHDQEK